jgi:hypothetical protein
MKIGVKRIIWIIGMDKSGTSLVSSIFQSLGGYLGEEENILGANVDNLLGYYENLDIININEELLKLLNLTWHFTDYRKYKNITKIIPNELIVKANSVIEKLCEKSNFLVVKDPRLTYFINFWLNLNEVKKCDNRFVYVYRNPIDVARSLSKISNISFEDCIRQWEIVNEVALNEMIDKELFILKYEDLLQEPSGNILRIANFLNITNNKLLQDALITIQPSMRHHENNFNSLSKKTLNIYKKINLLHKNNKNKYPVITDEQITIDYEKMYRRLEHKMKDINELVFNLYNEKRYYHDMYNIQIEEMSRKQTITFRDIITIFCNYINENVYVKIIKFYLGIKNNAKDKLAKLKMINETSKEN